MVAHGDGDGFPSSRERRLGGGTTLRRAQDRPRMNGGGGMVYFGSAHKWAGLWVFRICTRVYGRLARMSARVGALHAASLPRSFRSGGGSSPELRLGVVRLWERDRPQRARRSQRVGVCGEPFDPRIDPSAGSGGAGSSAGSGRTECKAGESPSPRIEYGAGSGGAGSSTSSG